MNGVDYALGTIITMGFLSVALLETWRLHQTRVFRTPRLAIILVSLGWAAWYAAIVIVQVSFSRGVLLLGWTLQLSVIGAFVVIGHSWHLLTRKR